MLVLKKRTTIQHPTAQHLLKFPYLRPVKTAVVILNWNGKKLLQQFLPSVIRFSPEATIYVADNASTDGSATFLQEKFPQVNIIQNIQNGGYAKGYNDALVHLSEDIFILLNSDVEVTPNWLQPILHCFETQPNTAAVQPKILDYKRKDFFEYAGAAGGFIDYLGYPFCRGRIFDTVEKDAGQYDEETTIFWASGACLAIRKKAFEQAGKLDESYFAHQEEIDLCWRLYNLDYQIKYTGKSTVYHVGGATLSEMDPRKTLYNFRNSLCNLVKNHPSNLLWPLVLLRLTLDGIAGIRFLLQVQPRQTWAIVRAHFGFYARLSQLLKERKKFPKRNLETSPFSIVFDYFISGKKKYSDLVKR